MTFDEIRWLAGITAACGIGLLLICGWLERIDNAMESSDD